MKMAILPILVALSVVSVRGQGIISYSVTFSGAAESPPNASLGTGSGTVNYDSVNHLLQLQAVFSGLSGTVSQTHIHGATASPFAGNAGIAVGNTTLPGFPLGVTLGSYSNTLDLAQSSIFNTTYLANNGGTAAGAEAAFAAAMAAGKTYWNIHSTSVPGGEIRGFLTLVPEPSTLTLSGLGILGLVARVWCNQRARRS